MAKSTQALSLDSFALGAVVLGTACSASRPCSALREGRGLHDRSMADLDSALHATSTSFLPTVPFPAFPWTPIEHGPLSAQGQHASISTVRQWSLLLEWEMCSLPVISTKEAKARVPKASLEYTDSDSNNNQKIPLLRLCLGCFRPHLCLYLLLPESF